MGPRLRFQAAPATDATACSHSVRARPGLPVSRPGLDVTSPHVSLRPPTLPPDTYDVLHNLPFCSHCCKRVQLGDMHIHRYVRTDTPSPALPGPSLSEPLSVLSESPSPSVTLTPHCLTPRQVRPAHESNHRGADGRAAADGDVAEAVSTHGSLRLARQGRSVPLIESHASPCVLDGVESLCPRHAPPPCLTCASH